jgi:U4/U6 small nuclear ribonucleoprotein PRP3
VAASNPLLAAAPETNETHDVSVFDPSIRTKRRKPGLALFQIGAVPKEVQQAIEARAAQKRATAGAAEASRSGAGDDDGLAMAMGGGDELEAPPDMEWWDAAVLAQTNYDVGAAGEVQVKEGKITNLVEHPVPIDPPVEGPRAAPQPLILTKKVCCLERCFPLVL